MSLVQIDPGTPADWGLPPKFKSWRPGQFQSIIKSIDSPKRFVAVSAPTGFGKSLHYITQAILSGERAISLTSTKGLQDQLLGDFSEIGLTDVRGKNAYACNLGGDVDCEDGYNAKCSSARTIGCPYYAAYKKASLAQLVVTNYAYWISINRKGEGLGKFGLMVLDEVHDAPEWLSKMLSIEVTTKEVYRMMGSTFLDPKLQDNIDAWAAWASDHLLIAHTRRDAIKEQIDQSAQPKITMVKELKHWDNLIRKLDGLSVAKDGWIPDSTKWGFSFSPTNVAPYAETFLFRGTPKVVMPSATVRPKTLQLMGIKKDEYEFLEHKSSFKPDRGPIIWVPTQRVDHRQNDLTLLWLQVDRIISKRLDRKGIIHTVSYNRAIELAERSKYRDYLLLHNSYDTMAKIAQFKTAPAPKVLVSPSMTTGWDFPYSECEYQIIIKLPFPDGRSKLMKARQKSDPQYGPYMTAQVLVQECGRGFRAADDQCETFILDDHVSWFLGKNKQHIPTWFWSFYRQAVMAPQPPSPLKKPTSPPPILTGASSAPQFNDPEWDDDVPF